MKISESCIFTIFGATGDLTKRKLIPALFTLHGQNRLPEDFFIVAVGRRDKSNESYMGEMKNFIENELKKTINERDWETFRKRVVYKNIDFNKDEGYEELQKAYSEMDPGRKTKGNRMYYLAVAPEFFEMIIKKLYEHRMLDNKDSWQRVMIEKPFGSDLETAWRLNQSISKMLPEDKIFRIDHYLGKEMIQNILSLRFGNSIFEPIWNEKYIDNVQIVSSETLGVGSRGRYYDKTGIVRDMLQSHILQMLSLIAMEPPASLGPEAIRDEKVKVLKNIRLYDGSDPGKNIVRGQYGEGFTEGAGAPGYRQEEGIPPDSETETFIALKTRIDNRRWRGVPFYIFAGKRLHKKATCVIIYFKDKTVPMFPGSAGHIQQNVLVIRIQPEEGVFFRINAKKPGDGFNFGPVDMNYCHSCLYEDNSPEAYEKLIMGAVNNDASLFTRWDELELSWRFIESIDRMASEGRRDYPNYATGTKGPTEAYEMIERDGRAWWHEKEGKNENI
ncbi:MAG: glucose-6-phosphate dehydrogenase [Clostridia bacterium]|nr:glucose-6-phosphate dehydrogenase [Clostridia bacterium]